MTDDVEKLASPSPLAQRAQIALGGDVNWSWGGNRAEYVPDLAGPLGLSRLEAMVETDETVGSMYYGIETIFRQLAWDHQPCVDGKPNLKDAKAKKMAAFADTLLVDMEHSMTDHVMEALTMIWAGFAPCEMITKQRDGVNSRFKDNLYGFRRLPLRDQLTVLAWDYDDQHRPTAMRQLGTASKADPIPLWKLLHYRTSKVLDRPTGRSLLRPAYRSYYLKRRIQDSEAIGIDRDLAGLPTFRVPMEDMVMASKRDDNGNPTPDALAANARIQNAIKAVRDMRMNEQGGLVLPSDPYYDDEGKPSSAKKYDFAITTTAGQRAIDPRGPANDYDRAIARVLWMQFMHLGQRSGGSYALSDNQSDLAMRSLGGIAKIITDEYDQKALSLIWAVNRLDPKYMPRLRHSPIAESSLEALGTFIARVAQAEPLFVDRPDLLTGIMERVGFRPEEPVSMAKPEPAAPAIRPPNDQQVRNR